VTFRFLTFHFLKPSHPLAAYKRAGTSAYALITGSSAGIGLGIAQELARHGFGIVLLGHLPDELDEAAMSLREIKPGIPVRILVLDARTATPEAIEVALQSISDLPVSILVNNVGGNAVTKPALREFNTYSCADVDAVIDQNTRFMARLTALMLPFLTRRQHNTERSLILNLSSGGMHGVPWLVLYGATKAFAWAFSAGLSRELQAHPETAHVDCLAIVPGEVHSQGNSQAVPAHAPYWDSFGRNVVLKADSALQRGWRDMRPHWRHDLELAIVVALPEKVRTRALTDMTRRKRDGWNAWYAKNR
jgi:17beta-estradiol 17-dehydrogenase / very-long-chain 3-oxoacyl-CoA reductase